VWSYRLIFQSVGVLFGVGIIPVLFADESCLSSPADGCVQFPLFALVFGIMHCLGCLTLFFYGKEPTLSQLEQLGGAKVVQDGFSSSDTVPSLMSTAMNWPFRCLMVAQITKAVGVEVPMVVMPFLTGSFIGENCIASGQLFGYLVIIVLCATLLAMPFWKLLSNKIGVYNTVVVYEVGQAVTLLTFLCSGYDNGDCSATYTVMFCSVFWGLSNTGSYLIKDLACDSVDYDEFLTGGLRREANYLMALEFVPKFMNIPGESLPFLIMAYLGYAAPPNAQPDCVTDVNATSVNVLATSVDNFCHAFYSSELPGEDLCSYTRTCADVVSDGVKFVCLQAKGTNGQCGVKQNDNVMTLLIVCFAVVPAFFSLVGLCALWWYPKAARTPVGQQALRRALDKIARGEVVEDPWRLGGWSVATREAGPHAGLLSYFWSTELRHAVCSDVGAVNYSWLMWRPLLQVLMFASLSIPGLVIMVWSVHKLFQDEGASETPLGLMLVGISVVGVWFNGMRLWAAHEVQKQGVERHEIVDAFNVMCAFTGEARLSEERSETKTADKVPDTHPEIFGAGREGPTELSEDTQGHEEIVI